MRFGRFQLCWCHGAEGGEVRRRIGILCMLMVLACPGCARRPASSVPASGGAACGTAADAGPRLVIDGWLRPAVADSKIRPDCRMIRAALADSAHSWILTTLLLDDGASVRVDGPGALAVRLKSGDGEAVRRDTGLYVPIHSDASAFLNSSSGPISIRHYHDRGLDGEGVRILVGIPRLDAGRTEVRGIEPVPGRWTHRR